jgi:ribosomal protein RSM22 (predicted rRNA methylase)
VNIGACEQRNKKAGSYGMFALTPLIVHMFTCSHARMLDCFNAHMLMISLPHQLETAISSALKSVPAPRWERAAQAISERYRAERHGGEQALVAGREEALGYAAMLMPATYAQLYGACAATAQRLPNWQPTSLLDLGSGPGTALWAAHEIWPSITHMEAWEREPAFIALGRELASAGAPVLQQTDWQRHDLTAFPQSKRSYDVVILAHVLNELSQAARERVISQAWQLSAGLLLIVEPGTSAAFGIIRAARDQLLTFGAHSIAPCPHTVPCPLANDWCHFPQRLERPAFQRRARNASSAWEDAKYSYAAVARIPSQQPIDGRIIREPEQTKGYITTQICTPTGIQHTQTLKRDQEAYRTARKQQWGEIIEPPKH